MSLLRFVTAGSVDDGKSTLIGRLLFDTQTVFEDQVVAIEKASIKNGRGFVDLSLITDGLQAEREQGITIDVAYRYFATTKRKFIVADCPGHKQYTRNMVTGASNAQLAVLLVDATHGLREQTRRHASVCAWLGLTQIVLAVNKLDLVDWSEEKFDAIAAEFAHWCKPLGIHQVQCIPMSALEGDMIVHRGEKLNWYEGPTLLEVLENADTNAPDIGTKNLLTTLPNLRFVVQAVQRSDPRQKPLAGVPLRAYAGRIEQGELTVGSTLTAWPSGLAVKVRAIQVGADSITSAEQGRSVTLILDREIDLGRGDVLAAGSAPNFRSEACAEVAWFNPTSLVAGQQVHIKLAAKQVKATVHTLDHLLNLETLEHTPSPASIQVDELAGIQLRFDQPMLFDQSQHHSLARFIMIDPHSAATLGAGRLC
jgi:sulfate adenylyltransferase subunit 1